MASKKTSADLERKVNDLEQQCALLRDENQKLLSFQSRIERTLTSFPAVIYACRPTGDYGATFISQNVVDVSLPDQTGIALIGEILKWKKSPRCLIAPS